MSRNAWRTRLSVVGAAIALIAAVALVEAGTASASSRDLTCTGGPIAAGTYRSVTVTGNCWIPDKETVTVERNLTVRAQATLNGFTPDLSHFNMATVHVHGNVYVGWHAVLGLGCSTAMANDPMMPFPLCSKTENSDVVIDGNLIADGPLTMYIDGIHVRGNFSSDGGGPGVTVTQQNPAFNFPVKDNRIDGNLALTHWRGGWVGIIRNHVGGDVRYAENVGNDPDANEVITNWIGGDLRCWDNRPPAQYGDATQVPGATPNHVEGDATGQCKHLTEPFPGNAS